MPESLLPAVMVASGDLNTVGFIRQTCQGGFRVLEGAVDADEALRIAGNERPTLAVVDLGIPGGPARRVIRRLLDEHPELLVVALLPEGSPEQVRDALIAGARDFVAPPLARERVRAVLERVFETRALRLEAVGQSVVVADLDWLFADAGFYLGVEPKGKTIHDLLQHPDPSDPDVLRSHLRRHSSGIQLLADPELPADAAGLDPEACQKALLALRGVADYVLLDLPTGLRDFHLPYLDASSFTFITGNATIGALKNMQRMVTVLQQAGFRQGRMRAMLTNFDPAEDDPTPYRRSLARLDSELSGIFPADQKAATVALQEGQPITRIFPRSPFTRAVREYLAPVLERSPRPPEAEHRPGLLERLLR